ncbi:hypothetical protein CDAR_201851 [Caerostris darwini]|uniref:Uncharacterized protein n=1 Tax=Caerostris darwini TaxID=1538125 RepID=A0AAV4WRG8_9ARAC|nr:hypothetical protein CDAR_201851 [Caerostris darwini]
MELKNETEKKKVSIPRILKMTFIHVVEDATNRKSLSNSEATQSTTVGGSKILHPSPSTATVVPLEGFTAIANSAIVGVAKYSPALYTNVVVCDHEQQSATNSKDSASLVYLISNL